jgi:hypothetical protein
MIMIIFETSNDNRKVIEESGILECEGVKENKMPEKIPLTPMGIDGIGTMALSPQTLQLVCAFGPPILTFLLNLIIEFIKQRKPFTLEINGKKMSFEGCAIEKIKDMLTSALKDA